MGGGVGREFETCGYIFQMDGLVLARLGSAVNQFLFGRVQFEMTGLPYMNDSKTASATLVQITLQRQLPHCVQQTSQFSANWPEGQACMIQRYDDNEIKEILPPYDDVRCK